jgi:hypothetical protein
LCEERVIAKNCLGEHGHCPGQNCISEIHQEYLDQGQEGYEPPPAPVDLGQFQFIPDIPVDEDDPEQVQEAWDLPVDRMPPLSDNEEDDFPDLEDDSDKDEPEPHKEGKHQKKKKKKAKKKKRKKVVQPSPHDVKQPNSAPGVNYGISDFDGVAAPGPVPTKSESKLNTQSVVRDSWAKKYPQQETEELKGMVQQSKTDGSDCLRQFMKDLDMNLSLVQGLYEFNKSHTDADAKTGTLKRRINNECEFVRLWKAMGRPLTIKEKTDLLANDLHKMQAILAPPVPDEPTPIPSWEEILPDLDDVASVEEEEPEGKGEPDGEEIILPGRESPPPPQPGAPTVHLQHRPPLANPSPVLKLCARCLIHAPELSFSAQQWKKEKSMCHQCVQETSPAEQKEIPSAPTEYKGEQKEHKQPSTAPIADQKRQLVEAMYHTITQYCPNDHSKVAGMIYELSLKELKKLDSQDALEAKCKEALKVLKTPPAEQWGDSSEEEDEEDEKEDAEEQKRAEVAAFMADMLTVRNKTIYFSRLPSTLFGRVGAKLNNAIKSAVHISELIKRKADTGEEASLIANRGVVYGVEECIVATVQDASEVSRLLRQYSGGRTGMALTLSNSLDTNNINIIDELGLNRKITTAIYSEVAAKIIADRKVNLANNISNTGKVTTQLKSRVKYAIGLLVDPAGDSIESRLIEYDKYIYDCTICYIINTLLFADYFINLTNPAARTPIIKTVFQELAATLMPLSIVASTALKGSLL